MYNEDTHNVQTMTVDDMLSLQDCLEKTKPR